MIERPFAFAFLASPVIWVAALVIPLFPRAAWALVLLGWVICLLLAAATTLRATYLGDWGWGILLGLIVLTAVSSFATGWGIDLAGGLLLGLPWIAIGYVARPGGSLGARFVVYGTVIVWGLLVLAAATAPGMPVGGTSVGGLLTSIGTVLSDQGQVFGGLVAGAPTPVIPLHTFFDPVYAALTGVSALGLMLVSVRPQTGRGVPLPVAIRTRRALEANRVLPAAYGFTAIQQAVFAERSVVEPPLTSWPPGLPSVLSGAAGVAVFLAIAAAAPLGAVLVATVGALLAVLLLVLVVERSGLLGRTPPRTGRRAKRGATMTPPFSREMLTQPGLPTGDAPPSPSSAEP